MKSVISYNVNGIRAAQRKGFFDWLQTESPDIICLQEIKAQVEQLDDAFIHPKGYHTFWHPAEKKGYSGVAIFSKEMPNDIIYGCGIETYDQEGRVLRVDFDHYSVLSVYFPSGASGSPRQQVKEDFLADFTPYLQQLKNKHPNLIISGDYNIAHHSIDLHDPVRNKNNPGFLPQERAWMDELVKAGFVDAFRLHHPEEPHHYSWWSYRAGARKNNKGWRIDYHMITESLKDLCLDADILAGVVHSDHCPIRITMNLP